MPTFDKPTTEPGGINPPAPYSRAAVIAMPRLPAYPYFLFMFHPEKWTVIAGQVVPELGKLVVQPGVGRVSTKGDPTDAIANRQKNGWRVLPVDVDGEGTSYVKAHRVIPRGDGDPEYAAAQFCHLSRFERVYPGSDRVGEGGAEYAKWLRDLIKRGVLPEVEGHVVERLLESANALHAEYTAKNRPQLKQAIEVLESQQKALNAKLRDLRKEGKDA